jgi:serine/threonine protein kinase
LNNAIGKCCAGTGGNLIYALNFFRSGASYYKVTEKIDISSFPCESIARLPLEKILLIAKSAVHSIRILHGLKIVHGDLKPDNLPIKEAARGYVVKLIDFDDSYFEGNPPSERESLVGTPEYYSPEQAAYIMDEDEEIEGSTLTCKSDIFTLGIIFSEYFSGEKPILPAEYKTTWTCINDRKTVSFKKKLHPKIEELIRKMLSLNPNDRPSISEVFNVLKDIKPGEAIPPTTVYPIGEKPKKPVLRFGPGLRPSGTKGIPPSGTPISKAPEIETKTPKIPEEPKPSTSGSGLRGSGLKIADKE